LGYAFASVLFLLFSLSRSFSLFAFPSLKSQLLLLSAPSIPGVCPNWDPTFSIPLLLLIFFLLRCFFAAPLRHFFDFCTCFARESLPKISVFFRRLFYHEFSVVGFMQFGSTDSICLNLLPTSLNFPFSNLFD